MMHNITLTVKCGPFLPARIRRMSPRRRKMATQRWLTGLLLERMRDFVDSMPCDENLRAATEGVVQELLARMRPCYEMAMVKVAA